MSLKIRLLLIAISLFSLVGCKKFMSVKPVIENNKLSFLMLGVTEPTNIQIFNVELVKRNCQTDCVMWYVINQYLEDGTFTYIQKDTLTINYGEEFAGMIVKQKKKELVSGDYSVSGDIGVKNDGANIFYVELFNN